MTDLGLYNFIQKALAEGKTKEEISTILIKGGGWIASDVDKAFEDVMNNKVPVTKSVDTNITSTKRMPKNTLLYSLAAIVVIIVLFFYFNSSPVPTPEEIKPKLVAFLLKEGEETCSGKYTIDHLSDITIGEYFDRYGGWQVFASHQTTCREGSSTYTYDGLDGPSRKVAVAWLRKRYGTYELFIPEFFKEAQEELNRKLQESIDQAF